MTKDEALEVINESVGGDICHECPYYIIGWDEGNTWKDCMIDNPHFCYYVQMEERSG
jgi:hypothetical protein